MGDDWKKWIRRAKSNLKILKTSKDKDICYEDLCFETQQSVEKA
jgi:HEPN domain-containing protein